MNETRTPRKRAEKPGIDISNLVYGKVPPNAKNVEKEVLGACLLDNSVIDIVVEILTPESFYATEHQTIFRAIVSMDSKNQRIDIVTVVEHLKANNELETVGGPYYITALTNTVVSTAKIEQLCLIIKQHAVARGMINVSGNTLVKAYEGGDVFDLIEEHDKAMTDILLGMFGKDFAEMDECLKEAYELIEHRRSTGDIIPGIPSGFPELDRITQGWQPGLIILAARPAVGKTALALQLAREAALNHFNPVPVAFFSLEMPKIQLTNRNLAAQSEIPLGKIISGNMDDADMTILFKKAIQTLLKARISIDDSSGLTITQLRAKARKLKRKWVKTYGTDKGLFVIDYLQLMQGSNKAKGNREQEISEISRGLKELSKELNVPIIALSQLSREVDKRKEGSKIPVLGDLRESGAIEQDADMVLFIYRPEYYGENTNQEGESNKGETHVRVAKHRNGSLETVKLRANLSIQKFYTWEDSFSFPTTPVNKQQGSTFEATSYSNQDECPF
jgi:replicative DNA helicase